MAHDHSGASTVVDHLVAPVRGLLGSGLADAVARMTRALDTVVDDWVHRHRSDDRYVVPGVNWDGFSHPTLFGMVHQQANPAQVEKLADDWERHGRSLTQRAEDLQRSLAALLPYWGGEASDQAARSVIKAVGWIGDVGTTTSAMGGPLQDSAGALRSAQATMPAPPGGGGWLAGAGAGAVAGMAIGGPIGAGIGAVAGGIASAFGFGSRKKELKRRAVQTMQRYEAAAVQVDSSTPRFVDSGVGRIGQAEYDARRTAHWQVPGAGTGPVAPPVDVPDRTSPAGVAPSGAVAGVAGPGGLSWRELTGRGGPGGLLGGGPGGWGALGGFGGFGGFGGAGGAAGSGPLAGRGGAAGRYGASAGGAPDDARAARRGGAAAHAAGSPLMPAAGARGDEDTERRRRYPYEAEPFKLDDTVAPPVIGG